MVFVTVTFVSPSGEHYPEHFEVSRREMVEACVEVLRSDFHKNHIPGSKAYVEAQDGQDYASQVLEAWPASGFPLNWGPKPIPQDPPLTDEERELYGMDPWEGDVIILTVS